MRALNYTVDAPKDGKHVSIGSIEPQFYKLLLQLTGLEGQPLPPQSDRDKWPEMTERFAAIFKTKTRDEWCAIMENTDICFAPILSMSEAMKHPQNVARGSFVTVDGVPQPGPAPRFSRTAGEIQRPPAKAGEHTDEALAAWGFSQDEIAKLRAAGAVA
jgi:alpha-methylacyl-CoA racemase